MTTTHEAVEHAIRLAEMSRQERTLRDALMESAQAATAAQAVLSRCLNVADHVHIERACGILSASVAKATSALTVHHERRKES